MLLFGQTGSGKTYTFAGEKGGEKGLVEMILGGVFESIDPDDGYVLRQFAEGKQY